MEERADAGRLGAGEEHLMESVHIPDGPRPHKRSLENGHVYQRQVLRLPFHVELHPLAGGGHLVHVDQRPLATTPAARPARVPSIMVGKTLLVPVEMGTRGIRPQLFATARLVPSPPRVTRQSTPISSIMGGCSDGVIHGAKYGHPQDIQGKGQLGVISRPPAEVRQVRHDHNATYTGGVEAKKDTTDCVDLFRAGHYSAVGYEATNIFARRRIRDDANNSQFAPLADGVKGRTPSTRGLPGVLDRA